MKQEGAGTVATFSKDSSSTREAVVPPPTPTRGEPIAWSPRHDVLGVKVSTTTYDAAVELILEAARRGVHTTVS